MRNKLFSILIITLFAMLLMANSFHRHSDLASMVKCPLCSGMYVAASTHLTVTAPLVIRSEITALPPSPCHYPLIQNTVQHSLRGRAPPYPLV